MGPHHLKCSRHPQSFTFCHPIEGDNRNPDVAHVTDAAAERTEAIAMPLAARNQLQQGAGAFQRGSGLVKIFTEWDGGSREQATGAPDQTPGFARNRVTEGLVRHGWLQRRHGPRAGAHDEATVSEICRVDGRGQAPLDSPRGLNAGLLAVQFGLYEGGLHG
jgi:hypothetical protein